MNQRQIKFRAWDSKRNKMYFCGDWHYDGEYQDINFPVEFDDEDTRWDLETKEITLMQFTGLLDKNGKEIYEGDILRFIFPKNKKGKSAIHHHEVFWNLNQGAFYMRLPNNPNSKIVSSNATTHEAVGNIYENKELLK